MGFIKNNLLKAIEYTDNDKSSIVYKFPMDGRTIQFGSKLTVREGQVAVFMNKGKIADVFMPGMHTLKTSNLPILTQLLSLPFGFKSPFYADVFFVNTRQFTSQKWGTASPITMRDSEFGTIRVRGFGSYAFRVTDAKLFLGEISGTATSYSTEDIESFLRSHLVSSIADTIAESNVSALDLSANLKEFSTAAQKNAAKDFEEMGLKLTKLIVESLSFPPEVEKAIDARSSVGVIGDVMDDFVKYQSASAMREMASNPSGGGIGMVPAGFALGEMMKDSLSSKKSKTQTMFCPSCGAENKKTAKFCTECGKKLQNSASVCSKCGNKVPPKAKFCPECGNKL